MPEPDRSLVDAARTLARLARVLERTCTDLTLPQYRLLLVVAAGDQRAGQLAAKLALAKPTVTALVDGLVERGLVRRDGVAGDRRAVQLGLTPAGRRALAAADRELAAAFGTLLERAADRDAVLAGLAELRSALDDLVVART